MTRNMNKKGNHGFTLIEIMIALAITGIVVTAMISVFTAQQRTFTIQSQLAKSQAHSRMALEALSRDIRMAGYTGAPLGGKNLARPRDASLYPIYVIFALKNGNTVITNCTADHYPVSNSDFALAEILSDDAHPRCGNEYFVCLSSFYHLRIAANHADMGFFGRL